MASQYALSFSLPDDFPRIIKSFSQEILHAINMEKSCGTSSSEIYGFAAKYFAQLAAKVASENSSVLTKDELNGMARQLFLAADTNESGSLDGSELEAIMTELASALGFTKKKDVAFVVKSVMDVADLDANGVISYEEFLPVASDIVQTIYAKTMDEKTKERKELEELVVKIFNSYDVDGNGYLDAGEFNAVFQALTGELGLDAATERLATEVMSVVDADDDDHVSLKEFTPLCAECLRVLLDDADNAQYDAGSNSADTGNEYMAAAEEILLKGMSDEDLENTLLELFQSADLDNSGTLESPEFSKCLLEANIGLTQKHVNAIMKDVDANSDGLIDFVEFAPLAYGLLVEVIAAQLEEEDKAAGATVATDDAADEQAAADEQLLAEAEAYLVHGFSEAELLDLLQGVFEEYDVDNSKLLDPEEFKKALMTSDLKLSADEVEQVLQTIDTDGDGHISYEEFIPVAFRILVEITRDEMVEAADAAASARTTRAEQVLVHSLSQEELTGTLLEIFQEADKDGSGKLDREEFTQALMSSDVGFAEEEILLLGAGVDVDEDGLISFEEFAPLAFDLLVEHVARAMEAAEVEDAARLQVKEMLVHGLSRPELENTLKEIFTQHDTDNSGFLDQDQFYDCLKQSDLGLTEAEIQHFRNAIDANADGKIDFDEFAPLCYDMLVEVMTKQLVDAEANE